MNFMLNKYCLLACLLILSWTFSTSLQAQKTPRYQGLLWEISGKGTTRPSYLYGTMHVPEKLAFNLSDSFFVALRAVDMVSLETDHLVWQSFLEQMQKDQRNSAEVYYGNSGSNYLEYRDLYNTPFEYKALDNRLFEAMFAYKPMMTNEFLFRSNQYRQDFEEDTYLDLFIFQAGKKLGKTVIGLETMEGSFESVTRARIPDDDEQNNERYYGGGDISEAYRKQDLNTLDSLNTLMSPGKNFRKWMLTERNAVMANGIDSIAKLGKTMFSAVGAAHLPGDDGVIEMLRRKGYTLRPITFSLDTDKKDMTEIENMKYPVTLSEHWAEDSVWSAKAPSRFFETSKGWRISQSMSADMCNGVYYAVYRIKTYGLWVGQSPEYITQRIDSLIYEKVPGKIQERKRFSAPFPGHEITTKTRRGDIQRYKIFVTPSEVMMFLIGGNREYAAGPEGNEFLNSIQLNSKKIIPQAGPTTLRPRHGGFTVTMPHQPVVNTFDDYEIGIAYSATFDPGPDSTFYFIRRTDFYDPEYIEEDTFELNIFAEKIAEDFTKQKPDLKLIQNSPYPTLDFSFQSEKDQSWYYGRLVIDGAQYYLLGCRKKKEGAPLDYFNSFAIQPLSWPNGFMTETDTVMRFTIEVPKVVKEPVSQFHKNLMKIGEEIVKKNRRQGGGGYYDYEQNQDRNKRRIFSDEFTQFEIAVASQPFESAFYENRDSLHAFVLEMTNREKLLHLQSSNWNKQGDTLEIGDLIYSDTNSNRRILHRTVLTYKTLYLLTSVVNGDKPTPEIVSRAFNTFTPTDTVALQPIVYGKVDLSFFENLYDSDSLVVEEARQDLEEKMHQKFESADFSLMKKAIDHPKFNKQPFDTRTNLVSLLSNIPNATALGYLEQLFVRYNDSIRLQIAVIEAIAQMKTKASTATFMKLVPETITYLESDYFTWEELSDTLELLVPYTQKLVQLILNNSPHQSSAINILDEMLNINLIKSKDYARLKPYLISSVRYQLQKNRFSEEEKKGNSYNERYGGYYETDHGAQYIDLTIAYNFLMPFYEKDKVVKELFQEGLKYGTQDAKSHICLLLLKAGHPVSTEQIATLLKNEKLRYPLYNMLVLENFIRPYSTLFSDSIALAKSFVMNRLYNFEEKDTLRLVSQHKASYEGLPAIIYFWNLKKEKEKETKFVYSIIVTPKYEAPKTKVKPSVVILRRTGEVQQLNDLDTEAARKEFIRKKIGEIRFEKRKRYRSEQRRYGGGYDY
jgi:uncharacterized protein YbaP (TraB family)